MANLSTAIVLATAYHDGQKRKITGEPYIFHPIRVMLNAAQFGDEYAIVAILHDTIEDTALTINNLWDKGFSKEIVDAVSVLTKRKGIEYDDYLKGVRENSLARVVKILDIEDNLSDMETVGVFSPDMELNLRYKYATALKFLRGR